MNWFTPSRNAELVSRCTHDPPPGTSSNVVLGFISGRVTAAYTSLAAADDNASFSPRTMRTPGTVAANRANRPFASASQSANAPSTVKYFPPVMSLKTAFADAATSFVAGFSRSAPNPSPAAPIDNPA